MVALFVRASRVLPRRGHVTVVVWLVVRLRHRDKGRVMAYVCWGYCVRHRDLEYVARFAWWGGRLRHNRLRRIVAAFLGASRAPP